MKACGDGQERSSKTKRCMKKCKTGTKRNPETNRCKSVKTKKKTTSVKHTAFEY